MYCYLLFKILVHSVLPRLFLAALYFLTVPSVISFLFRTSCPAYHSCPAFPVSIFLNNLYTPLHFLYCPAPCSKVFLLSTPVLSLAVRPVSCPVCHNWSILLYPNTQFNIIALVFIFEFCKLSITYVIDCFSWTYCPRGSVLIVLFILSGCPVLGILCYTCGLLLSYLSWFAMTSHNMYMSYSSPTRKRGPFCPITAVLMAVLSFVLDILCPECLLYHICPSLPVLACFLFLQMLSTLSFRV